MAISTKDFEDYKRKWAASHERQMARTNKDRFDNGEFTIHLVKSNDDPGEGESEFQEELARFGTGLTTAGIPYTQTAIAMDLVDAHGFPLPEFIVAVTALSQPTIAAIAGYAIAWVRARSGRKVRLRIGDFEAEASTVEEVEWLLEKAARSMFNINLKSGEPAGRVGIMDDAEIRGRLLTVFYDRRHNADGWVPTSDLNMSGDDNVSRQAIGSVCQQLADAGLIHWKVLTGSNEGLVIGMAKITGAGVDVVSGSRIPSIDVRFCSAGKAGLPSALDSGVKESPARSPAPPLEAERAVYETIETLVASGKRAYAHNVPSAAENALVRNNRGTLSRAGAAAQVRDAIVSLDGRGIIEAHAGPHKDWLIRGPLTKDREMPELNRKIFVVHGHDEGARESIARYLERLGFEPVILHEQANQGRTIIEKFEAHGDVGFAVVLLTPDDQGGKIGGDLKPRARQNVVFELGYFVGRLGRGKVCALIRGELEFPSDYSGVVYQTMDTAGGWKNALAKELHAAGYNLDWSKVVI